MPKKLYALDIRGRKREWSFPLRADPRRAREWQEDGLEIYEIINEVPQWVAGLGEGAVRFWCWLQDWGFLPL